MSAAPELMRVGRFEVDATDRRALSHLLACAWIPRSRREILALRAASVLPIPLAFAVRALGAPDASVGAAPSHAACAAAVREAMGEDLAAGGLHLLPAIAPAPSRRVVFAWRGDALAVVAKVATRGEPSIALSSYGAHPKASTSNCLRRSSP